MSASPDGDFNKLFFFLPAASIVTKGKIGWSSGEIWVGRLQVKGFSTFSYQTQRLASDLLRSLNAVMAEWWHFSRRHTAVLGNKGENTSWGEIDGVWVF